MISSSPPATAVATADDGRCENGKHAAAAAAAADAGIDAGVGRPSAASAVGEPRREKAESENGPGVRAEKEPGESVCAPGMSTSSAAGASGGSPFSFLLESTRPDEVGGGGGVAAGAGASGSAA